MKKLVGVSPETEHLARDSERISPTFVDRKGILVAEPVQSEKIIQKGRDLYANSLSTVLG